MVKDDSTENTHQEESAIENPKSAPGEAQTKSNVKTSRRNELTDKQIAFINAYTSSAGNRNATKSAVIAGYSERTATKIASQLISHPRIQSAIQARFNWTFDQWKQLGIDSFNELPSSSANKVRFWEIIGKSSGFFNDQLQINTINVIGDQDIAKIRAGVAGRIAKRLANEYAESPRVICEQPVDKSMMKEHNTSGGV
jgi:hypothetical protein